VLRGLRDDALKTMMGALIVAFTTGAVGGLLSGAWQTALLALSAVGILIALLAMIAAVVEQEQKQKEGQFAEERAKDAEQRDLSRFERLQRDHITRAAAGGCDAAHQAADVSAMLEASRKQISSGRESPVELLVLAEPAPNRPNVIAQAGRFDQAQLAAPSKLVDWIESLEAECSASAWVVVDGERWRVLGISDGRLDSYDKFEVQRVATHLTALKLAHRVAEADALRESA
jgi:membrane protein implicated in regulation of membrane protease activity